MNSRISIIALCTILLTSSFGFSLSNTYAIISSPPYDLGDAGSSGVLATATITTSGTTTINGDVNLFPTTLTSITGPFIITGTTNAADAPASSAVADALTAYNNLSGLTCDTVKTGEDLAGQTLTPGVYCFATSAPLGSGGTLTLDGPGKYVFQTGTTLVTSTNSQVLLINGASASDVFWVVGSSATLASGGNFKGTVLAGADISQTGGTGLTIDGRLFAPVAGSVTFVGGGTNPTTVVTTPSSGQPVGGIYIPIDTASLLLAGVSSVSMWMIPVVVAGAGIGVFVIARRK